MGWWLWESKGSISSLQHGEIVFFLEIRMIPENVREHRDARRALVLSDFFIQSHPLPPNHFPPHSALDMFIDHPTDITSGRPTHDGASETELYSTILSSIAFVVQARQQAMGFEQKDGETKLLRVIPTLRHYSNIASNIPSGSIYVIYSIFMYIFWHSIWHSFWHLFWHSAWHCIWHSRWHSRWCAGPGLIPLHLELDEARGGEGGRGRKEELYLC